MMRVHLYKKAYDKYKKTVCWWVVGHKDACINIKLDVLRKIPPGDILPRVFFLLRHALDASSDSDTAL